MLTVAISTHGGYARFLPQAMASALEYADEVIVYDDGGECANVAHGHPVRYMALPKTGSLTRARERAIEDATGDFLLHLDADDWLIAKPPETADWCYSDVYTCNTDGAIDGHWDYSVFSPESAMRYLNVHRTLPVPMKAVFRVSWLREHGLSWYEWPHTSFAEDCRTCIEYLKHGPRIGYMPRAPFYVYRLHEGQDTASNERRAAFQADLDAYLKGEL